MAKKSKRLTILTIKSDDLDEGMIQRIRKEFKKALKSGKKTAIFGVGVKDSIEVTTIKR